MKTMQSKSHWYVYELFDPRTDQVFYVGKGKGKRIDSHEKDAAKGICSKKTNKINSIHSAGLQIGKRQVAWFWDEQAAYDHETDVIEDYGLHNLTNIVPGGNGAWSTRLHIRSTTKQWKQPKPLVMHEWVASQKSERLFECFAEWFKLGLHKNGGKLQATATDPKFKFHAQISEMIYNKCLPWIWEKVVNSQEARIVFAQRMQPYGVEFVNGSA
jgi:hypothetical protein